MIDMLGCKWGEVYNLGCFFNSLEDDLGFVILFDGWSGYFFFVRDGGFGQDDVYMFKVLNGLQGICLMVVLSGVVNVMDKIISR